MITPDWSKHTTWPNLPLLKLGSIWGYTSSDIPQLSNLASHTEKYSFNIYFKARERRVVVIKEGTCFFVLFCFPFHEEVPDNTSKWTFHAVNSKLLVNIFPCVSQNNWRIFNAVASIRRENMLVHVCLSFDIIFSRKLTVFLEPCPQKTVRILFIFCQSMTS